MALRSCILSRVLALGVVGCGSTCTTVEVGISRRAWGVLQQQPARDAAAPLKKIRQRVVCQDDPSFRKMPPALANERAWTAVVLPPSRTIDLRGQEHLTKPLEMIATDECTAGRKLLGQEPPELRRTVRGDRVRERLGGLRGNETVRR